MEEKIKLIKENLKGNYEEDVSFLNSLYDEENAVIEDAKATIEAINIVLEELNNEKVENVESVEKAEETEQVEDSKQQEDLQTEQPERTAEEVEIDGMIDELLGHIDQESDDQAIDSIEKIIPRVEKLTQNNEDDGILYCSFKSEFEKVLFEKIFAGEKQVIATPYANDTIYIIYADLLLKKKRRSAAMDALDRAIYWNFLSRDARERKLQIYYDRKAIVKYLENLKKLQMISYTPEDIADCYNKYAFIFNDLKDTKSAYAMYRLSYDLIEDENVKDIMSKLEEIDPTLKDMTNEQVLKLAEDNEVVVGANSNIINAQRSLATEFIQNGMLEQAKVILENDYSITRNSEIANVYNQILVLQESQKDVVEEEKKEEKPKKTTASKKKTTTKKTNSTTKKTTSAAKKTTTKSKK